MDVSIHFRAVKSVSPALVSLVLASQSAAFVLLPIGLCESHTTSNQVQHRSRHFIDYFCNQPQNNHPFALSLFSFSPRVLARGQELIPQRLSFFATESTLLVTQSFFKVVIRVAFIFFTYSLFEIRKGSQNMKHPRKHASLMDGSSSMLYDVENPGTNGKQKKRATGRLFNLCSINK